MPKLSAGVLLYRRATSGVEVLLVHPGGPIWAHRDAGAWSIPKGEYLPEDDALRRAEIEFAEELGSPPPAGTRHDLGEITQAGGKRVRAWSVVGDFDTTDITSNTFEMEWPRGTGVRRTFPEVDRAQWFMLDEAHVRIVAGQKPLLDRLLEHLGDT